MTSSDQAPPRIDRRITFRILALGRPHLLRLLLAGICMILSTGAFLVVPYALRLLTDSVFVHHDAQALNRIGLLFVVVIVFTMVFGFFRSYLLAFIGGRIVADLRVQLYDHMQSLSLDFYDERRTGDLMSRLGADTVLVQGVLTGTLLTFLQQSVTLVAVIVVVLVVDWRLAVVTFILAPLIVAAGLIVGKRTRELSTRAQEQLGEASIVLEETLSSMRVVKAFGREDHELDRYAGAVERTFQLFLTATRIRSLFESAMGTVGFIAIGTVFWFGGHEVLAGRLSPGGLISFIVYMTLLIGPIQTLSALYTQFQQAAGGAARVFEVLDTSPSVVDAPNAYPLPRSRGHVRVEDLRFTYRPDLPEVLHGVSLEAQPGQRVALVGASGAGKTTLISLLPRFYDPTAGAIYVDSHDIGKVTMRSLRAVMAIVPQEPTLFGGTIRENIAYGRIGASEAEIETAARAANAHDFIQALPDGYDAIVGERGVRLSGGQRQRIAIARAILKDPLILILDEATSSLDNESEALVQEALERLMEGRTTFVIAHRLTTVENAHSIVVLDRGLVIEQGTHNTLMQQEGMYYRLYTRDFQTQRSIPVP